MSQKRSSHTERILKGLSKKATKRTVNSDKLLSLKDQYDVIKEDFLKLRRDLQKGYDMAKDTVEKKSFLNQLFKTR